MTEIQRIKRDFEQLQARIEREERAARIHYRNRLNALVDLVRNA